MSKALEMRSRAMMVALVGGFDLTLRIDWLAAIRGALEAERPPARHSMLVGAGVPGLADWLTTDVLSSGSELTILEEPGVALATPPRPGQRLIKAALDDYAFDPRDLDQTLSETPASSFEAIHALMRRARIAARGKPLIADASIDHVVQVWLANRLDSRAYTGALAETLRICRKGACLTAMVLLADEPLDLAAGVAPAVLGGQAVRLPTEQDFLAELTSAGWHGATLAPLCDGPVFGRDKVEVRAFVVRAYSGKAGPCFEQGHAVVYRGPFDLVHDDDGHVYPRGRRVAVCQKTHDLLMRPPYAGQFISLPCYRAPKLEDAPPFDCNTPAMRPPAVTKGFAPLLAAEVSACCGPGSDTCC